MARTIKGEKRVYSITRDKCGATGRNVEVDDRISTTPRTKVLHAQDHGKIDTLFKVHGALVRQETKTNCGKVSNCYAYNIFDGIDLNDRAALEAFILPDVDIVAYGYDIRPDYDVLEDLFVFTREQFLDFLFGYGKPLLRVNSYKGTDYCLNINTYQTSDKKFSYFMESCLAQPTKGEYLVELGRRKAE